ncbi:hypothetical protein [Micromonospora rifamycinica]|uniref:hypothetical protein n=1 Tax=Micromonospora rifamycinica TaxID=291594 RepID=UPI00076D4BE2|nr:hypothetical protein [Micromonospora rifamycinica]KWV30785.1 hypothetical protein AWV63_21085 [Micromonospora rifamycinica]
MVTLKTLTSRLLSTHQRVPKLGQFVVGAYITRYVSNTQFGIHEKLRVKYGSNHCRLTGSPSQEFPVSIRQFFALSFLPAERGDPGDVPRHLAGRAGRTIFCALSLAVS